MNTKELLTAFSGLDGTSGLENNVADYGMALLRPYGEVRKTPLGSVVCAAHLPKKDGVLVMLDAHMDEIGMIVTYIEENGFLKVVNIGGLDRRTLTASPVVVHGKEQTYFGVVCSTPPHLQGDDEKKIPKMEDIYLDVGMNKEQAEACIQLGDRVTLKSSVMELAGGQLCGKALDDRACCVIILRTLELLQGKKLSCGVTAVFSTMEEVGGQGAKTAAYDIDPTHAVVLDVSFAYTPDAEKSKCGELGKGGMIGIAPILDKDMTDKLIATAKAKDIPFQYEVMNGKTGTNADGIVTSRGGVKTAMLSLPLRYMHTPVEVIDSEDIEHCAALLAAYLMEVGK